jgi:hypothetical protein
MFVGDVVMLLKIFIVVEEWKLLSGSVGTIIDVIYADSEGPAKKLLSPCM